MTTALIVIDMQMEMEARTRAGRDRVNPGAEARIADLLALFRARGLPVVHVHHDEPGTAVALGQPGGEVMACARPVAGEPVFAKSGSSAFSGTGLDRWLRLQGIGRFVLVGAVAGFCITSTTRAAHDLGFEVILPADAVIGFDVADHAGAGRIDADTVLRVTLALLGADFATVVQADSVDALIWGLTPAPPSQ